MQHDTPVIVTSNAAMVRSILQDSKAIGYFSFGFLRPGAQGSCNRRVIPLELQHPMVVLNLKRELFLRIRMRAKAIQKSKHFFNFLVAKKPEKKSKPRDFYP